MSKKLREQFEKETGKSFRVWNDPHLFSNNYVEWLEQSLKTGQVDAIVIRHTLEEVNKKPELLNEFGSVRIYSNEHNAYWKGSSGYTTQKSDAKIWDAEVAYNITKHCGPEKGIEFIGV